MRIAFVTPEFYPFIGGISHATFDLAKELVNRGHTIDVITRQMGFKKFERVEGIGVHRVKVSEFPGMAHVSFIARSTSIINKLDPEVVYGQTIFPSGIITAMQGMAFNRISIVHARGGDVSSLENANFMRKKIFEFSLNHNKLVFSLSEDQRKRMEKFCSSRQIYCIPNGVREIHIRTSKKQCKEKFGFDQGFHVIYVGRLVDWKGIEYAIKSIKDLPDITLHLVGRGASKFRKLAEALNVENKALNVENKVIFHGEVPRENAHMLMKASDVFLYPTLRGQGLGNAVLEAMELKLPIVASEVGYLKDIIQHHKSGLLVPPKNPQAIKEAILELKDNPALKKRLSKSAFKVVNENFRWHRIAGKIIGLIRSKIG